MLLVEEGTRTDQFRPDQAFSSRLAVLPSCRLASSPSMLPALYRSLILSSFLCSSAFGVSYISRLSPSR